MGELMSNPSPFQIGREIGNNFGKAFSRVKDENAIDRILSESMATGDPEVLQNNIGKILSQVSPERQGIALQLIQNRYSNIQKQQELAKEESKGQLAAKQAGYTYGVPPQVAAQQVKDKAKGQRLQQYGLGENQNSPDNLPNSEKGSPYLGSMGSGKTPDPTEPPKTAESVLEKMSDQQLRLLTGHPDREISEPAKAILKGRDEERNLNQKKNENWTKFGMERAKKVLDKAEEIAQSLPVKKTALNLMKSAIANKNLGFWSTDNLAEITGIEGFRSKEGSIFKTAGKEYFLGNISRAGARPNQWIEQQISDMMTKIGRDTAANLSVARALQNETDIDEERVRLTEDTFSQLRKEDKDIGDLGPIVNKNLSEFAEQKQIELFNDLRAIKAIDEKKPQKFHKVADGIKISPYMVDALLEMFNNNPDKALQEAKKLGYSIE